jgi:hypothetical protein
MSITPFITCNSSGKSNSLENKQFFISKESFKLNGHSSFSSEVPSIQADTLIFPE